MEPIKTLLEQQPLMALFLTIAIGYLVGEINVKGFSLGVGAVLFVAIAMGWFAPKSVPSAMVGTLGLALFLYGVGVQYGTQFFIGLTSRGGLRANMIALTGVLAAGAVSLAFMKMMDLKLGHALGLFAGSGTSTAALQAAVATLGNDDPAVGYSVAYPLGVGGPILFLYIAFTLLKPKIQAPTGTGLELLEIAVRNPELSGMALGFLVGALQLPLPGIGKLSVGLAGVLIMALILGKLRRTGGMNWTIPLSANLVIRNLGLTLFLAQVGMASGPKFAATVRCNCAGRARAADPDPGPPLFPPAVRRGGGHRCGRLWQSGDPLLREQAHSHRPAGHRLRYDLSRHDHREDPLRGHRPGVFLKPLSLVLRSARWRSARSGRKPRAHGGVRLNFNENTSP